MKIIVDGNDGTGKSSLVSSLKARGIDAQDRGEPTFMTDNDSIRPRPEVFYVILDAPVSVSRERLRVAGKGLDEKYHTVADLTHYRKRFMEVYLRLPDAVMIDSTGPESLTLEMCLEAIRPFL